MCSLRCLTVLVMGILCLLDEVCIGAEQATAAKADSFQWERATPESQGLSSDRLDALRDSLAKRSTTALLIIRNDKIVYEWYDTHTDFRKPLGTASLAKAIVGGMALAVEITDGKMSIDDLASKYIPQWRDDPVKSKITIRQLGSHTSGIADASERRIAHEDLTGWKGDFWKRLQPPNDPFTISRDLAPLNSSPGERMGYSNPGIGMMCYCITAALRDAPQHEIRTLLRDRIMRPINVPDEEWSAGYDETFHVDELPLVAAWGGGSYSANAQARIGRLVLRRGDWEGQRLLSVDAVRNVTTDAGLPGHCGMGWWTANERLAFPPDTVYGSGAHDRLLIVIPSLKMIAIRSGQDLMTSAEMAEMRERRQREAQADGQRGRGQYRDPRDPIFYRPLMQAVVSDK